MSRTLRVCTTPGCGTLTDHGMCTEHRKIASRGRGYTGPHRKLRAEWAPVVATGTVPCTRCGARIEPGQPWDLGHTDDRTTWTGPEHASCNRATRAHAARGGTPPLRDP